MKKFYTHSHIRDKHTRDRTLTRLGYTRKKKPRRSIYIEKKNTISLNACERVESLLIPFSIDVSFVFAGAFSPTSRSFELLAN